MVACEAWDAASSVDTDLSLSSFFILDRADITQRRVSPNRVVEAFYIVERISPDLLSDAKGFGRWPSSQSPPSSRAG